ncbi:MAG: hypothetical protein BWY75_02686 [bacterium ADurb.Bin425]|nr:MAG: hypothetical protein BWY75_02686 [bacterium ADurb.Bin425]
MFAPGGSHKVDTLGGAAGENYFAGFFGIDKTSYRFSRTFVHGGGFFREGVDAAMYIGVIALIILAEFVDDA